MFHSANTLCQLPRGGNPLAAFAPNTPPVAGSTPVVEDVVKPATCGDPLTLMRRMDAPFVYVRNWSSELAPLLVSRSKVAGVSNGSNVIIGGGGGGGAVARGAGDRRRAVRQWYLDFNRAMRVRFLSQLAATFLELAP